MEEGFAAVRRAGARRGVGQFRVEQAVLLFVSLTFAPLSYRHTLLPALGLEVTSAGGIRRQAKVASEQMMHLLGA
jgi:hypothetical protein